MEDMFKLTRLSQLGAGGEKARTSKGAGVPQPTMPESVPRARFRRLPARCPHRPACDGSTPQTATCAVSAVSLVKLVHFPGPSR